MKSLCIVFFLLNVSVASAQEYEHNLGCSTDQHILLLTPSYNGSDYVTIWGDDRADVIPLSFVRNNAKRVWLWDFLLDMY